MKVGKILLNKKVGMVNNTKFFIDIPPFEDGKANCYFYLDANYKNEIGAGWLKVSKKGQNYIKIVINVEAENKRGVNKLDLISFEIKNNYYIIYDNKEQFV